MDGQPQRPARTGTKTKTRTRTSTTGDQHPATWPALAVAFLAISLPMWVDASRGEGALHLLSAGGFTLAALAMVLAAVRARRDSRR